LIVAPASPCRQSFSAGKASTRKRRNAGARSAPLVDRSRPTTCSEPTAAISCLAPATGAGSIQASWSGSSPKPSQKSDNNQGCLWPRLAWLPLLSVGGSLVRSRRFSRDPRGSVDWWAAPGRGCGQCSDAAAAAQEMQETKKSPKSRPKIRRATQSPWRAIFGSCRPVRGRRCTLAS